MRSIPPANRKLHLIMCRASPPPSLCHFSLFPCSAFQLYLSVRSAIYFYVLLPKISKNKNKHNNNNARKLRLADSPVGQRELVQGRGWGMGRLHCSSHSAVVAIKTPSWNWSRASSLSLVQSPLLPFILSPSQCWYMWEITQTVEKKQHSTPRAVFPFNNNPKIVISAAASAASSSASPSCTLHILIAHDYRAISQQLHLPRLSVLHATSQSQWKICQKWMHATIIAMQLCTLFCYKFMAR